MNLKDMEGCAHSLSVVLSCHLHVETEENHEKPQSGVVGISAEIQTDDRLLKASVAFLRGVYLENLRSRLMFSLMLVSACLCYVTCCGKYSRSRIYTS
jgi:hypothetical protein